MSSAPLVFIYTAAVDEAGHNYGSLSSHYWVAAQQSDALLANLWQVRQPNWTVLALSDHGHLPLGGHGDVEPEVRWVRACLAGPGIRAGTHGQATVPDLNAILAERLQMAAPALSVGRSLTDVLSSPHLPIQPGTGCTIPSVVLALLLGGGLFLSAWSYGQRVWQRHRPATLLVLPWGMALALLFLTAGQGSPSLSQSYVYPALPLALLVASLPAALFIGLQLWTLLRLGSLRLAALWLLTSTHLIPPLVLLTLTSWPVRHPPLVPFITGWTSALLMISTAALVGLALWNLVLPWTSLKRSD